MDFKIGNDGQKAVEPPVRLFSGASPVSPRKEYRY